MNDEVAVVRFNSRKWKGGEKGLENLAGVRTVPAFAMDRPYNIYFEHADIPAGPGIAGAILVL